jgi:hypothetical protein
MFLIFRYTTFVRIRMIPGMVALLLATSAAGADLSGIWTGALTDRNGDPQDLSFRFSQKGEVFTGKMYGDNESTPITGAKLNGSEITFSVTTELNGQITSFVYTGSVDGDQMDLTRLRVDANSSPKTVAATASPATPAAKPPQGQTFRLKRLT